MRQIAGCTMAMMVGQYSGRGLARAYTGRGNAHRNKGDLDRAAADDAEASRLGLKD